MSHQKKKKPNKFLRKEREQRGWSQEFLAEKVDTTKLQIGRWERGEAMPSPYYRRQLCELFRKTAEELGFLPEEQEELLDELPPAQETPLKSEKFHSQEKTINQVQFWSIPYPRDVIFTGRKTTIEEMYARLHHDGTSAFMLALTGMSGVGKTHTATEYAYRYAHEYHHILWISAETQETTFADVSRIVREFGLHQDLDMNPTMAIGILRQWLHHHEQWLLILDNVENMSVIRDLLPQTGKGHVVLTALTSRVVGSIAFCLEIEHMNTAEGVAFLLRRAKILKIDQAPHHASVDDNEMARKIIDVMGGLPLALDQTGAYIDETGCSIADYLEHYQVRRKELLARRGETIIGHPLPISVTFSLLFDKVKQMNAAAVELLRLCAFLHSENIPETIITSGSPFFASPLQDIACDGYLLDDAIQVLRKYALIQRNASRRTLSMHRLVQEVLKGQMEKEAHNHYIEWVVKAVEKAFMSMTVSGSIQEHADYFPHVIECMDLITHHDLRFEECVNLLYQAVRTLYRYRRYELAELAGILAWNRSLTVYGHYDVHTINCFVLWIHLIVEKGQYSIAEFFYQWARMRSEKKKENHPHLLAEIYSHLANVCDKQGKTSEAEQYCMKAATLYMEAQKVDPLEVAMCMHTLGIVYTRKGLYGQAEEAHLRAMMLREQAVGSEHPEVAKSLTEVAYIYVVKGEVLHAKQCILRALSISEKSLAPDHPDITRQWEILAIVCEREGDDLKAEELLQQVLSLRMQVLEPMHPEILRVHNQLAVFYRSRGRQKEAVKHEQQVKNLQKTVRVYSAKTIIDAMEKSLQKQGWDTKELAELSSFITNRTKDAQHYQLEEPKEPHERL